MTNAPPPTRSLMPGWLPRFNLLIGNRVQGLWAPWLKPWAVVHHTGRKSGRSLHNPVMAFRRGSILAIGLPYGSEAHWVKNVLAADGCDVVRGGRRVRLANPRVVTAPTGEELPYPAARLAGRMGVLVGDLVPADRRADQIP